MSAIPSFLPDSTDCIASMRTSQRATLCFAVTVSRRSHDFFLLIKERKESSKLSLSISAYSVATVATVSTVWLLWLLYGVSSGVVVS